MAAALIEGYTVILSVRVSNTSIEILGLPAPSVRARPFNAADRLAFLSSVHPAVIFAIVSV
jgi:hypothetical protein